MSAPLISIITPGYNAAATIAAAIRSVQEQDFKDWEMIVVDDFSDDGMGMIAEHFAAEDARIRLIRRSSNGGPAKSRNQGLEAATGRYIAFLDADDLFLFNKLSTQLKFMQDNDIAMSHTAYRRFATQGKPRKLIRGPARVTFDTLLRRSPVNLLTVMFDRERVGDVRFNETMPAYSDLALWLQLTKSGHDIVLLNQDLARDRISSDQLISRWFRTAWWTYSVGRNTANLTQLQALRSVLSHGFFAALKRVF